MRRALLALVLAALAAPTPTSAASEPYAVLHDWATGRFALGAPVVVDGVNAATLPFALDACPRVVLVDLLYAPTEAGAGAPGVGSAAILFEWRVELLTANASVATRTVRASGYGAALGVATEGAHAVRIQLVVGADVAWQARVRGAAVPGEAACLDPVRIAEIEANPPGPDAGHEWVELWNPGDAPVDLAGWSLATTHGEVGRLVVGGGTLEPGARIVLAFADGQALDNENESLVLVDAFGLARDVTAPRSDAADDARAWQLATDGGAWTFAAATPGEP